jgi:DNA-binding XRE family transcriptional regulator
MGAMPDIASVLKAEVARLARKQLRAETEGLKRALSTQRSELVALRRQVQALERSLKTLSKPTARVRELSQPAGDAVQGEASGFRFRAKGMASNRKRLGLSAAEFGMLVGATGQSVYSWEAGKSKPRAANLAAIASLRGIGKKEATARLEALKPAA